MFRRGFIKGFKIGSAIGSMFFVVYLLDKVA